MGAFGPRNPGVDLPYQTVLPTYAATAWYHHKLPAEHNNLEAFLRPRAPALNKTLREEQTRLTLTEQTSGGPFPPTHRKD
jgi:hypothetical protein